MGVCLYAFIEERYPDTGWLHLGEWDFGKAYKLSEWLWDSVPRGWPDDAGVHACAERERGVADEGHRHADAEMLSQAPDIRAQALAASMRVLEGHGARVRALFYSL